MLVYKSCIYLSKKLETYIWKLIFCFPCCFLWTFPIISSDDTVFSFVLQGKGQDETTGTTFSGVVRASEAKILPEEPENETDVDECIK